jgi:type II secretory pathway component HofQ
MARQAVSLHKPSGQADRANHSISLNVTNVDLRDFLRFLHEATGANIVVAPDVRGRVTAHINDVPWEEALESILRANDLVAERDGSVLRIMTVAEARREKTTCTYTLSNADASDVARAYFAPFSLSTGASR